VRALAVGWELSGPDVLAGDFPYADSFASFDAVLVDPQAVDGLWQGQALLEPDGTWRVYPGRDHGFSKALENLLLTRRTEVEDLLLRVGGTLVVRVRPPGEPLEIGGTPPRRLGRYDFLPRASLVANPYHLSLPQGLRFLPRRGRDIPTVDEDSPFFTYLAEFASRGYEACLVPTLGVPLPAFGRVLAQNRVGDVVAFQLPVGSGHIVFLPAFPGADPAEGWRLLAGALAELTASPLGPTAPDWLAHYILPGEDKLRQAQQQLESARQDLHRRVASLRQAQVEYEAYQGLLYPRGTQGLRVSAKKALTQLGFSCSERTPRFLLATCEEGELLVRVALSPHEPIGPAEHRALLVELDRVRSEERRDARGALLGVVEPRLDPRRRGWTWSEPVERSAREQKFLLLEGTELWRAVCAVLKGTPPERVRVALLQGEGKWRWKD